MKKILLIALIALIFISCSKTPFTQKEFDKDTALVYIYVLGNAGHHNVGDSANNDSKFNVLINGKSSESLIGEDEYEVYEFKEKNVDISIVRDDVDKSTLRLNLEVGKKYYLKAQSYSSNLNGFDFVLMNNIEGLKEIKNTKSSTQYNELKEKYSSTKIIKTEIQANSKLTEIQKAYEMKKEGLLTNEEFKIMKAEILAK